MVTPAPSADSPARQLAGFISKLDPNVAKLLRECRAVLRKRLPAAFELVYDKRNAVVIGFCTTERPSDSIVSLAAYGKGVNLNFYYGGYLPDPEKILQGSGSQNRFVRLESAADLAKPKVQALIDAAVAEADPPLPHSGRGGIVIRSVSGQPRPRR
jgi:hypothetical protein